ncbi:hypothetical protein M5D96_008101 [Drosophila gunungcola]|uniref:Uncharacterized protein n=1 Tax=Drosophila gunungcola TaxID=103775 RepID=A0A9P9YLW5_9MUSC|nr:hypothetical protein M5D96_008101 [Drosophila gunungcola]
MKEDAQVQLDMLGARPRPSIRLHNMPIMKHIQGIIANIVIIVATTKPCHTYALQFMWLKRKKRKKKQKSLEEKKRKRSYSKLALHYRNAYL